MSNETSGTRGTGTAPTTATHRYSVPQVARRLGISERAVRKQIETGKLFATKDGTAWVVFMDDPGTAIDTAPSAEPGTAPANQPDTTSVAHDNMAVPSGTSAVPEPEPVAAHAVPTAVPAVDLQPLVDLVDRLTRENRELAEASTIWQFRAHQLEDQLKQLTAGPQESTTTPETHEESVPHAEPVTVPVVPQRSFWRRLFGN